MVAVGVIVLLGLGDIVGLVEIFGRLVTGAYADFVLQAVRITTNTSPESFVFVLIIV
jgi:hypothetical protein